MTACPSCRDRSFEPRFVKNGLPIERCAGCGLGRTVVRAFDARSYYTSEYFEGGRADGYADYGASEEVLRAEFRHTVAHLETVGIRGGRLLEVGCAYGFFLDEARARFEVAGIEISGEAAEVARSRGHDVRTGPLDAERLEGLTELDAIVMLDVIEHLDDPLAALRLCRDRLRPGGVLVLTTGDYASIAARALGPRWRLMTPPQHLWFFTRAGLGGMAAEVGLVEAAFSHPWKRVPLPLIVFQLQRMLGGRARPPRWVPRLGVPLNLFDAMRVTYRRVEAREEVPVR